MKLSRISLLALACAALPLGAGAGVDIGISIGGPEIIVRSRPPSEREEVVPMSPGPDYIWIRGHWSWRHDRWEWSDGRWDRVARPGYTWIPGRWVARGEGWAWIEGHYAVQAMPPPPPGQPFEVIAQEAPPPAIFEPVPPAPGPDFIWIGGHWHWNGGWVWMRGHYDRHPHYHPGGGWEAGHWDRRGGAWVWREGHWR